MNTGNTPSTQRDLILRCRQGDGIALGELLDRHRNWLKHVATTELNGRASGRIDASDLVQQTLLSAFNRFTQFGGSSSGEFAAWLRQIHDRNIHDALRRHVDASKRSTASEQPIADTGALADSSAGTPSEHAIREERAARLRQHLDSLPKDQAEAVRLRHFENWTLAQLSEHFERSTDSVASLLKRGVENLRRRVRND